MSDYILALICLIPIWMVSVALWKSASRPNHSNSTYIPAGIKRRSRRLF